MRRQGLYRRDADPRHNVVFLHKDGANDEKIREAYPDLTPAQIHAALAYYYDNREEIDA